MLRTYRPYEELINAARQVIKNSYKPQQHVVGAALRLDTGQIVTGVQIVSAFNHVICAEAVALGAAVVQYNSSKLKTVVAVCHREDGAIDIVSPCGMCRDMMRQYSPNVRVLLPGSNNDYVITKLRSIGADESASSKLAYEKRFKFS